MFGRKKQIPAIPMATTHDERLCGVWRCADPKCEYRLQVVVPHSLLSLGARLDFAPKCEVHTSLTMVRA